MDKFLGSFKAVNELTEGFDNYFQAMQIPAETIEQMRAAMTNLISGLSKEADGNYKEFNDYGGGHKEEFLFKLGEKSTAITMGLETTSIYTLSDDGSRLDGVHTVSGQTTTSSRYFQGEHVVFEAKGNGATMKTFFTRVN